MTQNEKMTVIRALHAYTQSMADCERAARDTHCNDTAVEYMLTKNTSMRLESFFIDALTKEPNTLKI